MQPADRRTALLAHLRTDPDDRLLPRRVCEQRRRVPVLPLRVAGVPRTLRSARRWVLWRLEPDEKGRLTKKPYQPHAPERKASSTWVSSWGTWKRALACYFTGQCDGVGFVLGNDFFGFDADDCRDQETGTITPEVLALFTALNSRHKRKRAVHGGPPF